MFELAHTLKTPVYKIMEEMPYEELVTWSVYFGRRPIGWREDLRTAYLMRAQGVKESPEKIFPSLSRLSDTSETKDSLKGFKTSGLFSKLLGAKDGDFVLGEIE